MSRKHTEVAIAYDFDGTLSPTNMQEFNFIPDLGMKPKDFWAEVNRLSEACDGDPILAYLNLMLQKAKAADLPIRRNDIKKYGQDIELFDGVADWFQRVNEYGRQRGLAVKHYIVSSGIREMVEGSPIAGHFEHVYASAFLYDANDVAIAPAVALNYTSKTQCLFRINKGSLNLWDNKLINAYMPQDERPVPFSRMLYLGDGETDVPCMRLVKEQGGHALAVYKPKSRRGKATAEKLHQEGRVNFVAPADYRDGKLVETQVQAVLDRIAADVHIQQLSPSS
ncbi:haloacid dehalogenase-like hydrolase [bacterium]|nr:haloacid dehalogenase-like hydrolase [bacterium]